MNKTDKLPQRKLKKILNIFKELGKTNYNMTYSPMGGN